MGDFFNNNGTVALQQDIIKEQCNFSDETRLHLGENILSFLDHALPSKCTGNLCGKIHEKGKSISWNIDYEPEERQSSPKPVTLLPEKYYTMSFPKAKVLVTAPNLLFSGVVTVNGEKFDIDKWIGSENHNWGEKHTDCYAWGQVCGFDNLPDTFLECSTAQIKLGPFMSPKMSLAVLRVGDGEYRFSGICQALKNSGNYSFTDEFSPEMFQWDMTCQIDNLKLTIKMSCQKADVAGLVYRNPPGGSHTCLNSKVARCELLLTSAGEVVHHLVSSHGAAFEILTDRQDHGIEIQNSPAEL